MKGIFLVMMMFLGLGIDGLQAEMIKAVQTSSGEVIAIEPISAESIDGDSSIITESGDVISSSEVSCVLTESLTLGCLDGRRPNPGDFN